MRIKILLIFLLLCINSSYARNFAVLIGVSEYPKEHGLQPLSSHNDITILNNVLKDYFEIEILLNNQATFTNINHKIDILLDRISNGDTILIHFSCHGQQMYSKTNEEEDYLNEALIPYDAQTKMTGLYKGQYHLTDDIISNHIYKLSQKVGSEGLIITTIDACHSDDMHKGSNHSSITRGINNIFGTESLSIEEIDNIKKRFRQSSQQYPIKQDNAGNIIYISACRSYEKNREIIVDGIGYGPLSYSIYTVTSRIGFSDIGTWINYIFEEMNNLVKFQNPVLRSTINIDQSTRYPGSDLIEFNTIGQQEFHNSDSNLFIWIIVIILTFASCAFVVRKKKQSNGKT